MNYLHSHEIKRAARLRKDSERKPWLLIAEFAEIEGRIECVGIELRSYIRTQETALLGELGPAGQGPGLPAQPLSETYEAYWTGEPPAGTDTGEQERFSLPAEQVLAEHDPLAVAAGALNEPGFKSPHSLRATTLRELPLASEVTRLRRTLAEKDDALGSTLAELHLEVERRVGNTEAVELLEEWQRQKAGREKAFRRGPSRPGRPRKYDDSLLQRVAEIYSTAYRAGSPYPTRAVQDALGIASRSIAAKLVMKCREAGLLKPTAPREAGGVRRQNTTTRTAATAGVDAETGREGSQA